MTSFTLRLPIHFEDTAASFLRTVIFPLLLCSATVFSQTADCEWCGATEGPDSLNWFVSIAGQDEPGDPLEITGTIYQSDGVTPAPSVVLYVYHTNAAGLYPTRGDEKGNARRHGYLRGWLRTGADGRYRITTIRPGTYPSRSDPAHIHAVVMPPGKEEYWIDSYEFDDDPLLTGEKRARLGNRGGSGIIRLKKNKKGAWYGTRNIVLMKRED